MQQWATSALNYTAVSNSQGGKHNTKNQANCSFEAHFPPRSVSLSVNEEGKWYVTADNNTCNINSDFLLWISLPNSVQAGKIFEGG